MIIEVVVVVVVEVGRSAATQRAMKSEFSSRDKGFVSETFPNLAQGNLLAGLSVQRSIDLRNCNLLAATESKI